MSKRSALDFLDLFHLKTERYIKYLFQSGDSIRKEAAGSGVKWIYRYFGLDEPEMEIADSPLAAELKANELLKQGYTTYFEFINGADGNDYQNVTVYDLISKLYGKKDRFMAAYKKFLKSGIFSAIYLDGYAIVCRRPTSSHFNAVHQFHNEHGPAIHWRDGFGLYFLNGVQVPKKVVTTPAEKLDPRLIFTTPALEVRLEIIRKVGYDRLLSKLNGTVMDTWTNSKGQQYELMAFELPDFRHNVIALKMKNPSTGSVYTECVPPGIKTCMKALAWRDGEMGYIEPDVLT